ncbi:MAG: hypothetical protein AB7M12_00360 [Hyphomonadaceae bacterium]
MAHAGAVSLMRTCLRSRGFWPIDRSKFEALRHCAFTALRLDDVFSQVRLREQNVGTSRMLQANFPQFMLRGVVPGERVGAAFPYQRTGI